jgi:small subunit ribosomal protein S9
MTQPIYATGRRKTATARVFMKAGTGQFLVNKRPVDECFPGGATRIHLFEPLELSNRVGQVDLMVTVRGGGYTGQAGAIRHGIARALEQSEPELRGALKKAGYLTRDSRAKERKKYGQKGARARFQFSKR